MVETTPEQLSAINDASFRDDVEEIHSNTYYITSTHYDFRIAFGTQVQDSQGNVTTVKMKTAIYMNPKQAKDMAEALMTLVQQYEAIYGPQDLRNVGA